ncbi:MAG: peptidylprolyl isomerase [Sandaracinaceae bacterium]
MWDNFGKQIQTIFLILIVVLLSVIMGVVGFGTPGADGGCNTDGPAYAAQVYGKTITEGDFRAAFTLTGFNRYPTDRAQTLRLREYTLDGLIERRLLVREAERLGFQADPEEIMRRVAEDEIVTLGGPVGAPDGYPAGDIRQSFRDRSGNLSSDNLRRFIRNGLRRSVEEFVDWQVEEALAAQVRDTVAASVNVSPREVWDTYVQDTERAQLKYVRFDPEYYTAQVEVTDESVAAWMEENTEAVDTEYQRQRHRYTDLPEQTLARHILIGSAESDEESERTAARTLAESLLEQVQNGGDFAALAREHSTDSGSGARGGDLGWFPRGRMVPPFEEAAFGTEPTAIVDHLVESRFGFHIIEVQGRREGDVEEAVAKRELAEDLFRTARAAELAQADADRALAYLSDGHTMDELDEQLENNWEEEAPVIDPEADPDAELTEDQLAALDEEEPPAPRDPRAPQVRETRAFGRTENAVSGPFDSAELTRAAFEMDLEDPLPEEPMQLGDSFFVYQVVDRTDADEESFDDETRDRIQRRLLEQKRRETVAAFVGGLRQQADADGEIRINPGVLSYGTATESDDEGSEETASN